MPEVPAILVVDPDANIAQSFDGLFDAQKWAVVLVDSALEAFSYLRSYPVALLLLEIVLPDADGLCLLSMVRRLRPALPIVVISTDHPIDSLLKAMRLGARGYLFKPIRPEQVIECVQAILLETQPRRRARMAARPADEFLN